MISRGGPLQRISGRRFERKHDRARPRPPGRTALCRAAGQFPRRRRLRLRCRREMIAVSEPIRPAISPSASATRRQTGLCSDLVSDALTMPTALGATARGNYTRGSFPKPTEFRHDVGSIEGQVIPIQHTNQAIVAEAALPIRESARRSAGRNLCAHDLYRYVVRMAHPRRRRQLFQPRRPLPSTAP